MQGFVVNAIKSNLFYLRRFALTIGELNINDLCGEEPLGQRLLG